MKIIIQTAFYLTTSLGLFFSIPVSHSSELYFIDAHSQVDEGIEREELLKRMNDAGIQKTILSSRRRRKASDVASWAEKHPNKIVPSIRVKGKHYYKDTPKFYKKIKKQVNSGRFRAMSEVILYHAQKGEYAAEVIVYPEDKRVTTALDAAMEKGWPLVLHIEFAAIYGEMREKFYRQMETLVAANPEHPFCMMHMGQLKPNEVAELINKHKNLYFLTAHATPMAINRSRQPWVNMFQGKELKPEWKALMIKYPDRFIFALDNVWAEHWRNDYKEQAGIWRHALQKLPVDVAHAVAHGNAERLWKIADKK
jgi:predicted TIM-barrel fold metal-dependent hydrolase